MKPAGAITLERLERAMDTLCRLMAAEDPAYAEKCIPIYRRLEAEIEARRAATDVLAAARARVQEKSRAGARLVG